MADDMHVPQSREVVEAALNADANEISNFNDVEINSKVKGLILFVYLYNIQ